MRFGEPLPVRTKIIENLLADRGRRKHPYYWKGREREFEVYSMSVDVPKYRLVNMRTAAAQEAWLAKHENLPRDLFSRDQESDQAQEEQHKILVEMLDQENLYAYFKKVDQREPLVLSHEGFVVNGNRRLCAFRELLKENREKYVKFENIEAIILPKAEEQDLYDLEAELQVQPDIEAKYDWLQQAKMLKHGRDRYDYNETVLAAKHGLTKERITELFQLLQAADKYLEERGTPKRYDLVEKSEFALKKLLEGRKEIQDEGRREVFEKLTYVMMENPKAGFGRLHQAIPAVVKHYDAIVEKIRDEIDLPPVPEAVDADLDLLGPAPGDQETIAIAEALKAPENHDAVLRIVRDVLESERTRARDQRAADFALEEIRDANTSLQSALTCLSTRSNLQGARAQLESIEATVAQIRRWLDDHA